MNWNRTTWTMLDIFVEVSGMEFVKLCLVFVVTAVEASDARGTYEADAEQ